MDDVFVTRHGARIDNVDYDWLRKAGHTRSDDPHLSSEGIQGAQQLAAHLQATQDAHRLQHIVTSPFIRCVETADVIAEALGLPLLVEPGICEVLTTFPPGFLSTAELKERYPRIDLGCVPVVNRGDLRPEHGDGQAAARARQAAVEIRRRMNGPILFVGHGASCLGICNAFGGSGYIGYVSLSHFACDASRHWRVIEHGAVAHLTPKLARQSMNSAF
eukprot:GGOE01023501.1.p1 GENE.GGOE01023501.1~~GGOE01023501.1.p1  ORF type:complete len:236 (+),score=39.74 GGOE01023501.1:56-709(+)